jgi:hypothetical protein
MSLASLHPPMAWKVSTRPENPLASSRRELWWAVVDALNDAGIPYCLLGSSEDSGERPGCDMDFAVRPQDEHKVPRLLAEAVATVGAHLVQAIRHEISATYFAIVRQQGSQVAFVNPDCTTDYRRKRRLWIRAGQLLAERSFARGFYCPESEREFQYYLLKHVLKQSASNREWEKLLQLHGRTNRFPAIARFWKTRRAAEIESSLRRQNFRWFQEYLPRLLRELQASATIEGLSERGAVWLAEVARIIERVAQPSGLLVAVSGGKGEQRRQLARLLANRLAPAFRRCRVCDHLSLFALAPALVRSTLVVYYGKGLGPGDCLGVLRVAYNANLSLEKNTVSAVTALIRHLEHRTLRRLGLAEEL